MTTKELKKRYMALQEEARSIDKELKPLISRYRSICRKSRRLFYVADMDNELYTFDQTTGRNEPNGWNSKILFRLSDFEEPDESYMGVVHDNLVGIIKQSVDQRS